jgi:uncharacterized protein (TIGR03032 family)
MSASPAGSSRSECVRGGPPSHLNGRWAADDAAWRDPEDVVAGRQRVEPVDRRLLEMRVRGDWWEVLDRLDACVVVAREYEHLLLALVVAPEGPRQSFVSIPHPSGLAFEHSAARLHVASTRNPNQLYVFAPVAATTDPAAHAGATLPSLHETPPGPLPPAGGLLAPLSSSFLPGRLYLHDLALIGGVLHGSAAGLNAVVRFAAPGAWEAAWWPRSIERDGSPDMTRNYLQLNSIAAGEDLSSSFFSASAEAPSHRRPGQRNFPVDRRGVIFSGATREPLARGLTRPHSARLHDGRLWAADSGYGRLVRIDDGRALTVARLPGWARGLTFAGGVAFAGSSRVIPRFSRYAPGVDLERSVCGVHALDASSGEPLGSVSWPAGNQVFDIAVLPRATTLGFPALAGRRQGRHALRSFFFSYDTPYHIGVA